VATAKREQRQIVSLVTGANRGIGFEVCRQLAARGHRVVVSARTPEKADAAAERLRRDGVPRVEPLVLDVADDRSVRRAPDNLGAHGLSVDVLVNNAAILLEENTPVLQTSRRVFEETFAVNVMGAIAVAQALVPGMIERGYGRVVNVSSLAGQLSSMGTYAPAYSISKAALNAFTRSLAAETDGTGVLVNSANPGWVRTDMGGPSAPRSVAQGADTIVWLATLSEDGPTGGFFSERRPVSW
jgi:NAD(P)-dependent dehydrogenase (short-subunit alcohol dehydrogenase family)